MALFVIIACEDSVKYIPQENDDTHLIEFNQFSIILPKDFKYEQMDGIDSFVGSLKNKKSSFIFDYGRYSQGPPLNKESFMLEKQKHVDFSSLVLFYSLTKEKFKKGTNENIDIRNILSEIENLKFEMIEGITDSLTESRETFTCLYSFDYKDKKYTVPYHVPDEERNELENYKLIVDTIGSYQRSIALWKDETNSNISSVHFEPLDENISNKLFLGIRSDMEFDEYELIEIFKTIQIK